jgi:enoyl-CoA hydratase
LSEAPATYSLTDGIAHIAMDDGKANAFSHRMLDALADAMAKARADEAGAVVVSGRPGRFSAGFDLGDMMAGPAERRSLVEKGANLLLDVYEFPRPIVLAVTGHALAAGAVMLLTADRRVGAEGNFKLGLNEVTIGMPLPMFGVELARARLSKRHLLDATVHAQIYTPKEAAAVGYLDRVVEPEACLDAAMEEAARLAELKNPAYVVTKKSVRGETMRIVRAGFEEEMNRIG